MKTKIFFLCTLTFLFTSCSSLVHKNFVNMNPYDTAEKTLVTYDMKTKVLTKAKYQEYNGQFLKTNIKKAYPLKELDYKAINYVRYEKDLKALNCKNFNVQECIEKRLSLSKPYFEFEGNNEYILEENFGLEIFNTVRAFTNLQ